MALIIVYIYIYILENWKISNSKSIHNDKDQNWDELISKIIKKFILSTDSSPSSPQNTDWYSIPRKRNKHRFNSYSSNIEDKREKKKIPPTFLDRNEDDIHPNLTTLNSTEGRDRRLKSVHLMYVDGDQAYRPVRCVGVTMHRVQLSLLVTKRCLEGRMSLINLTPFAVYARATRSVSRYARLYNIYIYVYIYIRFNL